MNLKMEQETNNNVIESEDGSRYQEILVEELSLVTSHLVAKEHKWLSTMQINGTTISETVINYPARAMNTSVYLEMNEIFKNKVRNTTHPLVIRTTKGQMIFAHITRISYDRYIIPMHSYEVLKTTLDDAKIAMITPNWIYIITANNFIDVKESKLSNERSDFVTFKISFPIQYDDTRLQIKMTMAKQKKINRVINITALYNETDTIDFYCSRIGTIHKRKEEIGIHGLFANADVTTVQGIKGMSGTLIMDEMYTIRGILLGVNKMYLFDADLYEHL